MKHIAFHNGKPIAAIGGSSAMVAKITIQNRLGIPAHEIEIKAPGKCTAKQIDQAQKANVKNATRKNTINLSGTQSGCFPS